MLKLDIKVKDENYKKLLTAFLYRYIIEKNFFVDMVRGRRDFELMFLKKRYFLPLYFLLERETGSIW